MEHYKQEIPVQIPFDSEFVPQVPLYRADMALPFFSRVLLTPTNEGALIFFFLFVFKLSCILPPSCA